MTTQNLYETTITNDGRLIPPLLRTHNLGKQYGKEWALQDCSFTLPSGRIVALVGSNGSGKTTLLNVISGLHQPTTGQVTINGYSISDRYSPGHQDFRVSLVSQEKPLYPFFTVAEMLQVGRSINRIWDQPRAINWLRHFDIPLNKRCRKLSGGQQALVTLALAVGSVPPIMLLDEPLANLDPLVRNEVIQQLLLMVAEINSTIVLSTHVVTELAGVADYLLLLIDGKLILRGDVDGLLREHVYRVGPRSDNPPGRDLVIHASHTDKQSTFLVQKNSASVDNDIVSPGWLSRDVDLSELLLAYLRSNRLEKAKSSVTNGGSHDSN